MRSKILIMAILFGLIACQEKNPINKPKEKELVSNFDKAIEQNPYNAEAYFNRGQSFYLSSKLIAAKKDFDKAIEIDSLYIPALKFRARIQFEKNQFQEALKDLSLCLKYAPEEEEIYIDVAKIYLFTMQYQKAIDHVNAALKINKYNSEAYFIKGYCYKEAKDTLRATSAFQTTIEQNPNHLNAYMQLALFAFDKNDPLCVEYYNQAIRIAPQNQEAFYGKGLYYQQNKAYKQAIKTYQDLLSINHQSEKAYYNLGYVYLLMDSLDRSYKHFNAACRVAPAYDNAYYNRGLVAERLARYQSAMQDFRQTLSLNPDHILANEGLERVKLILKDK